MNNIYYMSIILRWLNQTRRIVNLPPHSKSPLALKKALPCQPFLTIRPGLCCFQLEGNRLEILRQSDPHHIVWISSQVLWYFLQTLAIEILVHFVLCGTNWHWKFLAGYIVCFFQGITSGTRNLQSYIQRKVSSRTGRAWSFCPCAQLQQLLLICRMRQWKPHATKWKK